MLWFAIFFFLSGLCSIVYELVWLRLSMARFGVTTALVSILLSVFMAGLGVGSWFAGRWVRQHGDRLKFPPLRLYAICELLIGISALVVPLELLWGSRLLEKIAGSATVSSGAFYLLSGAWLALTLVPWCACMGATIPLGMFAIQRGTEGKSQRSFSFLYIANVLGAVAGAVAAPALIELYGFHGTLRSCAMLNGLIFVSAFVLALSERWRSGEAKPAVRPSPLKIAGNQSILLLLFATGVATMAAEVIWIRLYTYFIGPFVYSFAGILAAYLLATFCGSQIYRFWSRRRARQESRLLWVSLAFFGLLPLFTADPRFAMHSNLRVFLGVFPFSAVIGFLTPMLVDRWSEGDPDRAGRAYAVNVIGCIVGPLLSGFFLLPVLGERKSMLILVLPWIAMAFFGRKRKERGWQLAATAALLIAAVSLFFLTKDYEVDFPGSLILRDRTATVLAHGKGMDKILLVNGVGMTALTPITKMMAHLTLAHLQQPPQNALIICFGMGTTFRSALSWGIPVTVVELVPKVPKLFPYYHPDGRALLRSPNAHVVIDDGRRFLDRTNQKFDAIIIDPPPPIEAAASSLLYSRDFYAVAKQHLTSGGILQQWIYDGGDNTDRAAITRALTDVFPYVRAYQSLEGGPAYHFLASTSPIPDFSAAQLVARTPANALTDMMEWGPAKTALEQYGLLVSHEVQTKDLIGPAANTPSLQDDRPINEYYWLRTNYPGLMKNLQ
jgi:predicted membrane-bound spermidine synthase